MALTLAAHIADFNRVRQIKDPDEKNRFLFKMASELVDKHLCPDRGVSADRLRVLNILSKLAEATPGCFGYGEPSRTVPLVLALLRLLEQPSAEFQDALLTLLRTMLDLLHLSDARVCALAVRDAVHLLSRLPSP